MGYARVLIRKRSNQLWNDSVSEETCNYNFITITYACNMIII
jgi:hypothetical protein